MPGRIARSIADRFYEKIQYCTHGSLCPYCCHEWQGTTNEHGYGILRIKRDGKYQNILTHRLGWELLNKRRADPTLGILHHCDNSPCGNGWHLYPGTRSDNIRDAYRRKRRTTRPPYRVGEATAHAKLTEADIPRIFLLSHEGHSQYVIAEIFHVTYRTIGHVLDRSTWKHVGIGDLNNQDAPNNRSKPGSRNPQAKLTECDIPLLWDLHFKGCTNAAIAKQYGVSETTIAYIFRGKSWCHIAVPSPLK